MSKLVIVESPAKAKTIRKYLGSGYEVTASMGHIRDLPQSQLGIDVEKNYEPKYINIKGKEKVIRELKGLAKVELQPGETKQVKIHLPLAAFALCNEEGTPIVEAGSYSVYVGASQPDARSVALMGQAPAKLTVTQSATQALDL